MASLHITIRRDKKRPMKTIVELNVDEFERMAAHFGFFNPDFVKSMNRTMKDVKAGRVRKIKSLKDLRKHGNSGI